MRPEHAEPSGVPLQPRSILHERRVEPALTRWVIGAIVVAALYFGRTVLIPIALSILLSFLLAPGVAGLRRLRFPRVAAVILAVSLALGAITVTGTILFSQAATLAEDAPAYAEGIAEKASRLRAIVEDRFGFLVRESPEGGSGHRRTRAARQSSMAALERRSTQSDAIPVEVHDAPPSALQEIVAIAAPAIGPIETILIVLILTVFILIQSSDLRDRLIRLLGPADLHRTTIALDDGAQRLSRYFLSQFAVNCTFGAVIWVGLFLIGVPSPGLWGILAGLLRFVPYVGSLIAVIGPLALAAAVDPGWTMMTGVVMLFAIVEPLVGYMIEPLLYGRSTGLSPVSVVVAAIFWTWLWGGLGLILSMPLTLMLVALGRHIPAFAFFDILLGDRPALSAPETFYQRILGGHVDAALDHAEDVLVDMSVAAYFDEVMLGGLRLAAIDMDRGLVDRPALTAIANATIEVVAALAGHEDNHIGHGHIGHGEGELNPLEPKAKKDRPRPARDCSVSVLCVPARGPLDHAISAMTSQLLVRRGCRVREIDRAALRRSNGDPIDPGDADIVCIAGLFDAGAVRRIDMLTGQIRSRFPGLRIVVGVSRGEGEKGPAESLGEMIERIVACEPKEESAY